MSETWTLSSETPVCPHCSHPIDIRDIEDGWGLDDGEMDTIMCEECGKRFRIRAEVRRLYAVEVTHG